MIILSARRTWITLRKLRSIQATPVLAQTMIMALLPINYRFVFLDNSTLMDAWHCHASVCYLSHLAYNRIN